MSARHSSRRTLAQERAARRAIIEKERAGYILLACDHFTTFEAHQLTKTWKPKGQVFWCETCNKWVKRKPRPRLESVETEPLF